MLDEAEYQKEYDKAAAELEAAAQATTARGPDGKFVKAEPVEPEKKPEPTPEVKPEPAKPEAEPDPLAELRAKVEKTEKALKDTQAWGTKNAQELAQLRKEAQERQRQANRPAILDANPELEQAIKYVVPEPEKPAADPQKQWQAAIEVAHPGIFDKSIDPELEKALLARFAAVGEAIQDPLIAIREISAEKLAHTERLIGQRFAAETAKGAQKSAMSVPGAGAGGAAKGAPLDSDLEAKNRILNMSPAEFEKERRRVLGL